MEPCTSLRVLSYTHLSTIFYPAQISISVRSRKEKKRDGYLSVTPPKSKLVPYNSTRIVGCGLVFGWLIQFIGCMTKIGPRFSPQACAMV